MSVLVHVVVEVPVVTLLPSLLSVDSCEDLAAGLLHWATLGFLSLSSLNSFSEQVSPSRLPKA